MGEGEEGSGASGNGAAVFGGDSPAGETGGIEETTEEVWDRIMDVNAKGVLWGVKHAVPAMRQAGGGSIANISSIAGLVADPGGGSVSYTASK